MRKDIILSKGLHFTEQELELSAISPLPAELYVREKLDEEWIANLQALLKEGLLEPQIVVGKVQNLSGLYIVEGHHTYYALQREGIKTVKALVLQEELDYITLAGLQIALNAVVQKPLTVKEKKALLLRLYLKYKQELGKDFWKQRAQIIQRLIEETEIPQSSVYRLLEEELAQEKEELKKIALELYKAGNSQEKIAQMLGVPRRTLTDWIKDLSITHSTLGENSQMRKIAHSHLIIFLNKDTLNPAFMELFSRALEEGKKVEEFFKEKGELFKKGEVEEFIRRLRKFLEKVVLRTYTLSSALRKKSFVELVKSKLALSVKACEMLYEESKPIYEKVEKAVKEVEELVEVVCEDNEVKNEDDARKALAEKLKEQGKKFALEYFSEFYAGIEDKVKECLSKYPVLTVEEVLSHYTVDSLAELSKEELREELLANFPTYKVPSSVIEELFKRIEEKREGKVKEELKRRALDPSVKDLDSIAQTEEEKKVLAKYYKELKSVFDTLKIADERKALALAPTSVEDLVEKLKEKGYRTFNAQELYKKVERVRELLKEFEDSYFAGVGEFEECLGEEDRRLVWRFNDLFMEVLNKKKKGGEKDHERWARRLVEENLSLDEVRKRAWQEEGILLSPRGLLEYTKLFARPTYTEQEKQGEKPKQEEKAEDTKERKRGISTKGLRKVIKELLELLEELKKEVKDEKALRIVEKIEKKIKDTDERLEVVEKRRAGLEHPAALLAILLDTLNRFSLYAFNMPVYVRDEEKGKLMKFLDRAVSEYEELAHYEFTEDYDEIVRAFLETYAYAFLRWKLSPEKFLTEFRRYRHDWMNEVRQAGFFYTAQRTIKNRNDIIALVENFLRGQTNG